MAYKLVRIKPTWKLVRVYEMRRQGLFALESSRHFAKHGEKYKLIKERG